MTGDASRFFSVRMSIVLTLFAAVLLSGMMVPSIAFGEETGVGMRLEQSMAARRLRRRPTGLLIRMKMILAPEIHMIPTLLLTRVQVREGSLLRLHMSLGGTLSMATAILPTSKESSRAGG